jgi:hypothetical protein
MARGANYNPLLKAYPDSERINSVSEGAEVLYTRLIAKTDDAGRYWANPRLVVGKLFSHRWAAGEVDETMIETRIAELESVGLIKLYEVDGRSFLEMVNAFKTFRSDVKRKIEHPAPPWDTDSGQDRPVPVTKASPQTQTQTQTHTKPKKKRKKVGWKQVLEEEFPALAQSPDAVVAWDRWLAYRREANKSMPAASTARAVFKKAEEFGIAELKRAVSKSIENGWTGLFWPEGPADLKMPKATNAISDFLGVDEPRVVEVDND